jgi:UDP-3-O-[3-hydroxymyristoyl] glucosamine N-acyltransferase
VEIGDDAWLMSNIVMHGPATIGKRAIVKDGAVIGSEGYGFVEDDTGRLIHAPQLGRVVIGNHVWIGSNSTIEKGMFEDTVIEDDVKIDDLVHVGRGSIIGKKSLITAGCVLAFHVEIGEGVRLGTNVSVRESSRIASGVIVGQGASVVNDLTDPGVYVGVPARRLAQNEVKV